MLTFAVMLLGVLAGRFFPAAHKSKNEKLQLACTLALIFAMGVSLGGGWCEVGLGTNINLSDTTHLYFDIEKTFGAEIATTWQWNAGMRWSF